METQDLTDRQLLLTTYHTVIEMNGSISKLWEDTYGDPSRNIRGIKEQVQNHTVYIDRQRTSLRTLKALLAALGISNLLALGAVVAKVIGG